MKMAKQRRLTIEEMEQHLIDAGLFERKDLSGIAMLLYDKTKCETNNTLFNNNELVETPHNTKSKVKSHKLDDIRNLEYNIVPFLKTKDFISKSSKERAHILHCYHTLMKYHRDKLASKSLIRAPKTKSIPISDNLGSTCQTGNKSTEMYVNRFGRQTKRKIYADVDTLEDIVEKNDINDEEWVTKTAINISPEIKTNSSDSEQKNADNIEITANETQKSIEEPTQIDEIDEIFVKLDANLTKTNNSRTKRRLKHTDKLFDKLKEDYDKRKQDELKMEAFEKTLPSLDDNYAIESDQETVDNKSKRQKLNEEVTDDLILDKNDQTDILNVSDDEEPFVRRRVTPPSYRKPIKRQKGTVQPLDVTINKTNSPKSSNVENKPSLRGRKKPTVDDQIPSNSKITVDYVDCPICGSKFSATEIEEHASSCGDFSDQTLNSIVCNVCDKVLINEEYNAHVSACIASQTEQ